MEQVNILQPASGNSLKCIVKGKKSLLDYIIAARFSERVGITNGSRELKLHSLFL